MKVGGREWHGLAGFSAVRPILEANIGQSPPTYHYPSIPTPVPNLHPRAALTPPVQTLPRPRACRGESLSDPIAITPVDNNAQCKYTEIRNWKKGIGGGKKDPM